MKVDLKNIGKRYNYEWIFRNVNYEFTSENNYVILGSNGAGKSTLLQVVAGSLIPSEGQINFSAENSIEQEHIYSKLSYAAPYLDLFEDYTLAESIEFQAKLKPFFKGLSTQQIIAITGLEKSKNKQLKYYSSGMKQRVRLALAILADTPLLLLDEPTSNLDKTAIDWYQQLLKTHSADRLIIVASNQQEHEYFLCNKEIRVEDFK